MYKIANQVIDAYDDVSKTYLKKLAKKNPDAYLMTEEEKNNLSDEDFALSVITKKANKLNKFPINDADSAWISNEYFDVSHHRLPKTAALKAAHFIKQACNEYGIRPASSVKEMAKEASGVENNVYYEEDMPKGSAIQRKSNVDMSKIAQVEKIGDNYTFCQYALPTSDHVKLACKYFEKYCSQIPPEYRHKYAAAVQKRAGELGLGKQSGSVAKYASDSYSGNVDAHLSSRASMLDGGDPKYKQALHKLSGMKSEMEPSEFAKFLHSFDKKAGLTRYYDHALQDPYRSTFAGEENPWANYKVKLASGNELSADQIQQVANKKYDKIKEFLGKDVANELKKNGVVIFESLPKDAQEVISGIFHGNL